jgi:hypothetical protein
MKRSGYSYGSDLKDKEQGFGDTSLKAMGLIMFFPTLIVLSVVVEQFQTETLAALLGTLAGIFFLSQKEVQIAPNQTKNRERFSSSIYGSY